MAGRQCALICHLGCGRRVQLPLDPGWSTPVFIRRRRMATPKNSGISGHSFHICSSISRGNKSKFATNPITPTTISTAPPSQLRPLRSRRLTAALTVRFLAYLTISLWDPHALSISARTATPIGACNAKSRLHVLEIHRRRNGACSEPRQCVRLSQASIAVTRFRVHLPPVKKLLEIEVDTASGQVQLLPALRPRSRA
jgi:hypothetical protein